MSELSEQEEKYFESGGEESLGEEPEAVIVEESEAEESEAPESAPPEEDGKPMMVPIQALHEARDEARRIKEALEARNSDFDKLSGRLDVLKQLAEGKADDTPKMPDWDEAPIDAGKALAEKLQMIESRLGQEDSLRQMQARVSGLEATYRQEHADYDDAVRHLVSQRTRELELFGFGPEQIQQQIAVDVQQISGAAMQVGKNPAEVFHNLAKERGFKPNGEAKEHPKPDPVTQLETIERGQKAAASVGGSGSPQPKNTLDAIMDMDENEFAALTEGDWTKIWR